VLYTVHFTALCLGGRFFPGHGVVHMDTSYISEWWINFKIKKIKVKM